MNPTDQEYWRQRRDMDPRQQWTGLGEKTGNAWRTDRDPHSGYVGRSHREPPTSMGRSNEEWEHSPSSQKTYSLDSAAFIPDGNTDPNGEPVTLSDEDQELARKKRELQLIEEQILRKKASIAMKKIEPLLHTETVYKTFELEREEGLSYSKADVTLKNNEPLIPFLQDREAGFSYNKRSVSNHDVPAHKGEPLKDRVNVILLQRRPVGFLRKVHFRPSDLAKSILQTPKLANNVVGSMKEYILSKDGLSLGDHPLKCRVKALMTQRRRYTCVSESDGKVPDVQPDPPNQSPAPTVLGQNKVAKGLERFMNVLNKGVDINLVPDVQPHPPSQSPAPTVRELNKVEKGLELLLNMLDKRVDVNLVPDVLPHPPSKSPAPTVLKQNTVPKGIERFLNVLNKGVDINLLTKIVNDDSEVPPVVGEFFSHSNLENNPKPMLSRKESQGSHSRALQQDHSQSNSSERRTEIRGQKESHTESQRISMDNEKSLQGNDGGGSHFGSSNRSMSPPEVEEKKIKLDQPHDQLQNLLKTLGLSFEMEELTKLTDRTQERLYGKKTDDRKKVDSMREKERLQERLQILHRSSSSSSSSGSSSSSSPCRRLSSSSKASRPSREQQQISEYSSSRERSGDKEMDVDREGAERSQDREGTEPVWDREQVERRKEMDMDRINCTKCSLGHHPYPENPTNPFPHPAAVSVIPSYASAQYSQYSAYHSSTYNGATSSLWMYASGSITPPSPYPPGYSPYPQNSSHHFTGSVDLSEQIYPYSETTNNLQLEDPHFMFNPDLSTSEGQDGTGSAHRCLQVIKTVDPQSNCGWLTRNRKKRLRKMKSRAIKKRQLAEANANVSSVKNVEVLGVPIESDKQTQLSQEVKQQLTEEEIKSNLKKKNVEVLGVPIESDKQTQLSQEVKQQLTEEEIKSNLKKKLEAFNQKMKSQNQLKPASNIYTVLPDLIFNFESTASPARPCGP